jgi:hypothetical protein
MKEIVDAQQIEQNTKVITTKNEYYCCVVLTILILLLFSIIIVKNFIFKWHYNNNNNSDRNNNNRVDSERTTLYEKVVLLEKIQSLQQTCEELKDEIKTLEFVVTALKQQSSYNNKAAKSNNPFSEKQTTTSYPQKGKGKGAKKAYKYTAVEQLEITKAREYAVGAIEIRGNIRSEEVLIHHYKNQEKK